MLLGETVDDSIGEAYDKVARFLGLGYPGGPGARPPGRVGRATCSAFPRPMLAEGYTFSFSGLKTAVVNHVRADPGFSEPEVAASFVAACMDVLCAKLRRALEEFGDPAVAIVGGVAASPILRARAQALADEFGTRLLIPPQSMATDNAAMIGVAGWHELAASGASATVLRARARPAPAVRPELALGPGPAAARPGAVGQGGEVDQHADRHDDPSEGVDALPGGVDQRVEERGVREQRKPSTPSHPERKAMERRSVKTHSRKMTKRGEIAASSASRQPMGLVEAHHVAVLVDVDPFGRRAV